MNNPNSEGYFLWAQPGNLCWIETSTEEKYVKATILQRNDQNQTVTVKYEAGNETMPSEISFFQILRFNEQSIGVNEGIGFEDMVNMDVLNEAEVLNNLKTRYKKDLIFTYIGPTLLVINPYKPITSDFSPQNFAIYSKQALSPLFSLRDNPPHVFAIGAKAFHQLIIASKSQAIVISGESGAGKTENTKFAMRFITSLSSESLEEQKLQDTSIEEKILGCNPILEAFGNAKTVRNDNSSRFGKYVKIQVQRNNRKIKGAEITNYLLEKSRVTNQAKDERNYHIFYHLLGCGDNSFLKKYFLMKNEEEPLNPKDFCYLNQSDCFHVDSLVDSEQFKEVTKSFEKLNFTEQETSTVWSILSAILHLGNLIFSETKFKQTNEKEPIEIENREIYKYILELLGVEEESLTKSLVYKSRQLKEGVTYSPLKLDQVLELRDSLSKALYQKLFNWLVKRMNMTNEDSNLLTIGLLDIFGFEKFDFNSLEQLCINFTNEKLHQLYIEYVFISEKDELSIQGLKAQANSLIVPKDNNKLIELFEGPNPLCVFSIMKDTKVPQTSDNGLLINLLKLKEHNPYIISPKKNFDKNFVILHTADNVEYNIFGFKIKNNDSFPEELENVLLATTNNQLRLVYLGIVEIPIQQQLLTPQKRDHSMTNFDIIPVKKNSVKGKGMETLLQQFDSQMKSLMLELKKCDVNFIRCIKPNEIKIKEYFKSDYVLKQIKYLGVLESVKIRKDSFPFRKDITAFWNQYKVLGKASKELHKPEEIKEMCEWYLLRNLIINEDDVRCKVLFGISKIYLKQEISNFIDKLHLNPQPKAIKSRLLVKQFRIWKKQEKIKKPIETLLKTGEKLKAFWNLLRTWICRQKFLKKKRAVSILMELLKKKMVKRICRVILFKRWKRASEISQSKVKKYVKWVSLQQINKYVKWKIECRKIELGDKISKKLKERFSDIKTRFFNNWKEKYHQKKEISKNWGKVFLILKHTSLMMNFSHFKEKIAEKILFFKNRKFQRERTNEPKETILVSVNSMGSFFRRILVNRACSNLTKIHEKTILYLSFKKYRENADKSKEFEEEKEKLNEEDINPKNLAKEVKTKFWGKLELKNSFSQMKVVSKGFYLKSIEILKNKSETYDVFRKKLFQLKKFNDLEDITKGDLLSDDTKYEPKIEQALTKSYIPVNNNIVIWKNVASKWLNQRISVNLTAVETDNKDQKASDEIKKLFKNFLNEKNQEKQFLIAQNIVLYGFMGKSSNLIDEIYYNTFVQIEKGPEKYMKLLGLVSSTFPKTRYKTPILNFLHALMLGTYSLETTDDQKLLKNSIRYCYRRIERGSEAYIRNTFPNEEEFRYIWNLQKIPIRIFFCNETPIWITIESYTTVLETISLVLKAANLNENLSKFFGLFIRVPEDSFFLGDNEWIIDYAFTKRIYLRIRWFSLLKEITNDEIKDLIFIQIVSDYLIGLFTLSNEEILSLAALDFFVERGSNLTEDDSISINKYIPKNFSLLENDPREVAMKILTKYSSFLSYYDLGSAKNEFLTILSHHNEFFSQLFLGDYTKITVKEDQSYEEYCKPWVKIFVKPFEISFVWENSGTIIKKFLKYKEICEYGILENQKAVFLRKLTKEFEEIYLIENKNYKEIYSLIKGYGNFLGKHENNFLSIFKNI